ncbi:hypothetical protein H2203_003815 [Taxawa tesnikishii (nom. ined.)]|nr:hypothetical protein H2203_003815 [Dothideales sp. JES 119]
MAAPEKIETRLFINGEFVESSDKKTFKLLAPATRKLVAERQIRLPVLVLPLPAQRAPYFKKLASLLRNPDTVQELAWLEASSMGRPVSQYFDAYLAADVFDHYAEAGWEAQGTSSLNTPGYMCMTLRQPYGVVAAIIPWNVPLLFFANKAAAALAAGNTVVVKSSEKAP